MEAYVAMAILAQLSDAERVVVEHLIEGRTNVEIARKLRLSDKTVKNHQSHILTKTNCSTRLQLTVKVYKERVRDLRRRLR